MTDLSNPTEVLARTIWGEARNQGIAGMAAVAAVVMNRVAKPCWWGKDVVSVCLKPFQFSCWLASDPNRAKLLSVTEADKQFAQALNLARQAIAGKLPDPTGGASYYYERHMPKAPAWALSMDHTCDIGDHAFFRTAA